MTRCTATISIWTGKASLFETRRSRQHVLARTRPDPTACVHLDTSGSGADQHTRRCAGLIDSADVGMNLHHAPTVRLGGDSEP